MNNNTVKLQMLKDVRIILWVIVGVSYFFRFWAMIFLAVIGVIAVSVMIVREKILKKRKEAEDEPIPLLLPKAKTETDVLNMAFEVMQRKISELVAAEYPNAKWVWEAPDAKKKIAEGAPVYIRLNHAGGYRRAEVQYLDLKVTAVIFKTTSETKKDTHTDSETQNISKSENFELMAFEWVDENIVSIGNRMNEAIGSSEESLHFDESELPIKECWEDICSELRRAGIENVETVFDGITIKFKQNNAERE